MRKSKKTIIGTAAALALGLFGVATAQASIISSTSTVDFTNSNYTLSLANGAATYSFANSMDSTFADDAAIETGGTGLVAANPSFSGGSPSPAAFEVNPFLIDASFPQNYLASFTAFDSFATIPYSGDGTYLALAFTLADGIHYGYAELSSTQFLGYGYETVAGMGIEAGAMGPTKVPEPGSLTMLAFGLALVGAGTVAARRRKI